MKKPRATRLTKEFDAMRSELATLIKKAEFVLKRSEFLYQQGLMWHVHGQEVLNDRNSLKESFEQLQKRVDAFEERLYQGNARSARPAKREARP